MTKQRDRTTEPVSHSTCSSSGSRLPTRHLSGGAGVSGPVYARSVRTRDRVVLLRSSASDRRCVPNTGRIPRTEPCRSRLTLCFERRGEQYLHQYELRTEAEDDRIISGRTALEEMAPSHTAFERQPSHEATLHCTNCHHASRINGDWIIEVHVDSLDCECPECGTTLDSRRDRAALTSQSSGVLRPDSAD